MSVFAGKIYEEVLFLQADSSSFLQKNIRKLVNKCCFKENIIAAKLCKLHVHSLNTKTILVLYRTKFQTKLQFHNIIQEAHNMYILLMLQFQ